MGITVLRCDDRLIHGQCIVKVLNDYKIDYIILVDAFTASNPVMSNIYKMSVPCEQSRCLGQFLVVERFCRKK